MSSFSENIAEAKTFAEVEKIVREAIGPSELMEFMRLDLGDVLRKQDATAAQPSVRFLVTDPLSKCAASRERIFS